MSSFYTNVTIYKNKILSTGYVNGKRSKVSKPYKPYLFVVSDKSSDSQYVTVDNRPVRKKEFDSVYEARQWTREVKETHGREFWGLTNFLYTYINDTYPGAIKYDASKIRVGTIDIEVAADEGFPNVMAAEKPITAITLQHKNHVLVWGCGDFKNPDPDRIKYFKCEHEEHLLLRFIRAWRQLDLDVVTGWNIEFFDMPYIINRIGNLFVDGVSFTEYDREKDKDIVINANDGPATARLLSPHRLLEEKMIKSVQGEQQSWIILGVNIIDYLAAYRKFTYTQQESYSLDNIANVELNERKLDYSEYDGLLGLYKNNYQKFIEYNIRDVELVVRLDEKMKLLDLIYAIAYDGKVNLNDAFTSVRMCDIIIHNHLMKSKVVVPNNQIVEKERQIEGAYVKDPLVGMHKWIVSFDLNSLYPHLIMQYNISPETYYKSIPPELITPKVSITQLIDGILDKSEVREYINNNNVTVTGTGGLYTREHKGFLPHLMERVYTDRTVWKKRMIEAQQKYQKSPSQELEYEIAKCNNMQMAKKIQLNSVYGALANKYFRWFDNKYAESVTMSGQLSIRWIEKRMNEYLNEKLNTEDVDYVIACDTDSMYITLDRYVDRAIENKEITRDGDVVSYLDGLASEELEPFIDSCYKDLAKYVNAVDQKMIMKREAIADKGIWTAKKHYVLSVHDMEGVRFKTPSLKVMGIEAVRSSTPAICRSKIKEAIAEIMYKDEDKLIGFVNSFRKQFYSLPFEDVAFPRGISNLNKYVDGKSYKKGTPIHVRGAIIFNEMLNEYNLKGQYQEIFTGEKIKFCYLKLPNPARENVISVASALPKQLGIDKYIDYEKQFSKSFIEPMKTITDAIGWKLEKVVTLEDFWN